MDNQNSMLGLLGMESTSFLEELSRTDEVAPVPSRGGSGALANGTLMPQDMASSTVEIQQRMPQQASWGVNQLPHGGAVHYQNAEYGPYGAAKQQQRIGHMSGYGSGMMAAGNSGSLQNHPAAAQYGYTGMSGMHNVALTPPRQAMSGSGAAWNHSPGSSGVPADPLAASSYTGMPGQHSGMVQQQHQGSMPQQMQIAANRSNGMQGQLYGQYHDFAAAAGAVQQTRMMGYSDSQNQMQEMGMSGGGYCQPMGSPPPASTRLMQMSGQAGQMPSQVHYQQQQQPRYPSMSANMESSRYMTDSQSHHAGSGHAMSQYQYNPAMMQGQPRMPSEGSYSHFYAQPLYRMPAYGATTQAQMMSPNAMAQMSPQARSSGSARPPDIRSPQPSQVPVCSAGRLGAVVSGVPSVSGSASFRPNLPGHTTTYTVAANSTAQVGPQRVTLGDAAKVGYSSGMPATGNLSAQQPMSSSLMIGNAARYAVPGYQMNTCQNVPSIPSAEMRQQLYSGQQQQMMDAPDRSHCFPQSHSQGYYQPVTPQQQQQSQYAAPGVVMGGLSPGQMAVHKQSQVAQQQQLLSPGQATTSVSVVCYQIFRFVKYLFCKLIFR